VDRNLSLDLRQDLKSLWHEIGIPATFSIYDVGDCALVLRRVLKEQHMDPNESRKLMVRIQQFKSQLEDEDSFCENLSEGRAEADMFREVYESYTTLMRAANALDFDDLTRETVRLLTQCPDVLSELGRQFRYICVDEYQDTSRIEAELLRLLSSYHGNLCVVGDVRQSIFRWRKQRLPPAAGFRQDLPEARRHVLSTNYRSAKRIVESSEDVIKAGAASYACTAARATEGAVCFLESDSDQEEALRISVMVKELVEAGFVAYSDIAILTRIRAVTNQLQEVFQDLGIPYAGQALQIGLNLPRFGRACISAADIEPRRRGCHAVARKKR